MGSIARPTPSSPARSHAPANAVDWRRVAYLLHISRALDTLEEKTLVPEKKVLYQFSARGHDMAQIILGLGLDEPT
jgi:2-oxoisovalerate dehydrogenase E1 component